MPLRDPSKILDEAMLSRKTGNWVLRAEAAIRQAQIEAYEAAREDAARVAEGLTVCTEWWEGLERAVRHPSPVETAIAIRNLQPPKEPQQ